LGKSPPDHIADPVGDTTGQKSISDRFMRRNYALMVLVTGFTCTLISGRELEGKE